MEFHPQHSCPICGTTRRRNLGQRADKTIPQLLKDEVPNAVVSVFICSRCAHIYVDPLPVHQDQGHYESTSNYFKGPEDVRLAGANAILEVMESHIPPGHLLDVGCGLGHLLQVANQRGWTASGIEPTPSFASAARERGLTVHEGILDHSFLPQMQFDAVTCLSVLEHVSDPLGLLRNARRVLRRGGLLAVEVPNGHRLEAYAVDFVLRVRRRPWTVRTAPLQPPFHLAEFSRESLEAAMRRSGFSVTQLWVEKGKVPYPLPSALLALIRTLEKLSAAMGRGMDMYAIARAI